MLNVFIQHTTFNIQHIKTDRLYFSILYNSILTKFANHKAIS